MAEPGSPLPNFIIGGAQKSGTTALHTILQSHPQILIPRPPVPQEIHFFDLDVNFAKGVQWYRSLFDSWNGEPVIGQTSPLYLYEPRAPERIADLIPEARFVFVLRNPIDRAYSHYWHQVRFGYERESFERALALEPARIAMSSWHRRHYSYFDRGRYALQLARFAQRFRKDRILVVLSESLRSDPVGELARIASFLAVDQDGFDQRLLTAKHNAAMIPRSRTLQMLTRPFRRRLSVIPYLVDRINLEQTRYPAMSAETRELLRGEFVEGRVQLEKEWKLDLTGWGD